MLGLQKFLFFVRTSSATLEMQPQENSMFFFRYWYQNMKKWELALSSPFSALSAGHSGTMNVKHMRKRRKTPNSRNFSKAETCFGTCCECFHSSECFTVLLTFADMGTLQFKTQELVQVPWSWTCRDMGINGRTTDLHMKTAFHSWNT